MSTITDLLPLLYQKTTQKKLLWNLGTDFDIWIKISSSIIEIEKREQDAVPFFSVGIRNSEGALVDQEIISESSFYYKDILQMFNIVKRQALKADENIEQIMRQLEKL